MKNSFDKIFTKAQQGELNGVETYLRLAEVTRNRKDAETFKKLAADEGRHASVFKQYTGKVLKPKKLQANAVVIAYRLLGKGILYPIIAGAEYAAIPKYNRLIPHFPEVKSVRDDERRHGDTLKALLRNKEYKDFPLLVAILPIVVLIVILGKSRSAKR